MKPKRSPSNRSLLNILLAPVLCVALLSLAAGCDPKGKRRSTSRRPGRSQVDSHQVVRPDVGPRKPSTTSGSPKAESGRIRIHFYTATTKPATTASKPVAMASKPAVTPSGPKAKEQPSQGRVVKVDTVTLEILKELRDSWAGLESAKARSDAGLKTP